MAQKKSKKTQQFRHQNGFGSIVKLSGNRRKPYGVRITTGWKDGKQIRKYLGYYKSEAEALIALAEYHKNGYDIDLSKLTLGEVYERWIKRIEQKASKNVLSTHKMAYTRFGRLSNIPLMNIKADHLQDWMDNIDLKPGSKKRLKSTMIQLYNYAIRNDLINTNYASYIEINEKIEKKGIVFSEDELKILWDNSDDMVAQWILILIYTGMRIGELLSLTADTMYLEDGYVIGGSKSEAGIDRVIPIHKDIMPFVKNHLGNAKHFIRDEKGRKMTYIKSLGLYKKFMVEHNLNVDHLPHDTRKTAVSLMHTAGIPIETVRVIVGHSGKGVTETVYLYKEPKELVDIINTVEIPYAKV
jgi:integrase